MELAAQRTPCEIQGEAPGGEFLDFNSAGAAREGWGQMQRKPVQLSCLLTATQPRAPTALISSQEAFVSLKSHRELGKEDVLYQGLDVLLCTRRCESLATGKFHRDTLHSGNEWIFVANG